MTSARTHTTPYGVLEFTGIYVHYGGHCSLTLRPRNAHKLSICCRYTPRRDRVLLGHALSDASFNLKHASDASSVCDAAKHESNSTSRMNLLDQRISRDRKNSLFFILPILTCCIASMEFRASEFPVSTARSCNALTCVPPRQSCEAGWTGENAQTALTSIIVFINYDDAKQRKGV